MKIKNEEAVKAHLSKFAKGRTATARHLDYLRDLALCSDNVVELGIKHGASSTALAWCEGKLYSYDLVITKGAKALMPLIGDKWKVTQADTTKVSLEDVPEHDLLFVDSLHHYHQVASELEIFAGKTKKWIVFHDTITFGTWGADGEKGTWIEDPHVTPEFNPKVHGIRLAIDEFMVVHPEWVIKRHVAFSHGLLTLERIC